MSVFASGLPYRDCLYIINHTDKAMIITLGPSANIGIVLGVYEYLTYDNENIGPIVTAFNGKTSKIKLEKDKAILCYNFGSMAKSFHALNVYEKFKIIIGELTITDEDGNVLLTLDAITPDDFEIEIDYGYTKAYLVIKNAVDNQQRDREEPISSCANDAISMPDDYIYTGSKDPSIELTGHELDHQYTYQRGRYNNLWWCYKRVKNNGGSI
jgi:hypothetical protein